MDLFYRVYVYPNRVCNYSISPKEIIPITDSTDLTDLQHFKVHLLPVQVDLLHFDPDLVTEFILLTMA